MPHLGGTIKHLPPGLQIACAVFACMCGITGHAQQAATPASDAIRPLSLTGDPLPGAVLGQRYSQTFPATGGTGPIAFEVKGNPPLGFQWVHAPGVMLLEGVPQRTGEYPLTLTVTDSLGARQQATYILHVTARPESSSALSGTVNEDLHITDLVFAGNALQIIVNDGLKVVDIDEDSDALAAPANETIHISDIISVGNLTGVPQTIATGPIPTPIYGNPRFYLRAGSSSGLPVTYTVLSGPAKGANPFTIMAAGTVAIRIGQPGNATYAAATPVVVSVVVADAVLTVTAASAGRTFDGRNPPSFDYSIVGFVNGDKQSGISGSLSIGTAAIGTSPPGEYPIIPDVSGLVDANYVFATVDGTLEITGGANQTIFFENLPGVSTGQSLQLFARSSSGLPISFSATGPATIAGTLLTITGSGTVTITANQAGNESYAAAAPVVRTLVAQ